MKQILLDGELILKALEASERFEENFDALWETLQNQQIKGYITKTDLDRLSHLLREEIDDESAATIISEVKYVLEVWDSNEDGSEEFDVIVSEDFQNVTNKLAPVLSPKEFLQRQYLNRLLEVQIEHTVKAAILPKQLQNRQRKPSEILIELLFIFPILVQFWQQSGKFWEELQDSQADKINQNNDRQTDVKILFDRHHEEINIITGIKSLDSLLSQGLLKSNVSLFVPLITNIKQIATIASLQSINRDGRFISIEKISKNIIARNIALSLLVLLEDRSSKIKPYSRSLASPNSSALTIFPENLFQETINGDLIEGSIGNDILIGTANNDYINGKKGNDFLIAGAGNDTIVGGKGKDTLVGGEGNDLLVGGASNNFIGVVKNIIFTSNIGANYLIGGAGDDTIVGGGSNDTLIGGSGRDRIFTAGDRSLVFGDAGNDVINSGGNNDTIVGGSGSDRIFTAGDRSLVSGNAGNDTIVGGGSNDTIVGGSGGDRIFAAGDRNLVSGDAGNDTIVGGGSNETLIGGSGGDRIFAAGYNNLVSDETGAYNINASTGNDRIFGGTGNDRIFGSTENDRLAGEAGNDTITGGLGGDSFYLDLGISSVSEGGIDSILDFDRIEGDIIVIQSYINNFSTPLSIDQFSYDSTTGALSFKEQTIAFLTDVNGVPSEFNLSTDIILFNSN
ncbi:MAG: calcium-binding protein [Prochloraceae cyanobacterium]|nr:calcium-binding protein [Prochloraceae cyanobacterium]